MRNEVHLGLGSNLGNSVDNIRRAVDALDRLSESLQVSSIYKTEPQGFHNQPTFYNATCRLWTRSTPFELLREINVIEAEIGRRRTFQNAPRILDIDILTYGSLVMEAPGLTIPHPRMLDRLFVLAPLVEISPNLCHPLTGELLKEHLTAILESQSGIAKVNLKV